MALPFGKGRWRQLHSGRPTFYKDTIFVSPCQVHLGFSVRFFPISGAAPSPGTAALLPAILIEGVKTVCHGSVPEGILYLAATAAVQFARGQSAETIELMGAFFNVLGDNLTLLSLSAPSAQE